MRSGPLVSLVITSYRGNVDLGNCLRSILNSTYANLEVVVMENSPELNFIEKFRAEFLGQPQFRFFINEKNIGYAANMNRGAAKSHGRYVFFLNKDLTVEPDFIEAALPELESDPRVLAGQCLFLELDDPATVQSTGARFSPLTGRLIPQAGFKKLRSDLNFKLEDREILGCSAALIIKREVLELIPGPFEGSYDTCYEDVDLCLKIWLAGYKVILLSKSRVCHQSNPLQGSRIISSEKNWLETLLVNFKIPTLLLLLPVQFLARTALALVSSIQGRGTIRLKALIRGLIWNLKNLQHIRERRREVRRIRKRSDWQVLRLIGSPKLF